MKVMNIITAIGICASCVTGGFYADDRYVDHNENKIANQYQEKMIISQISDYRLETINFQLQYLRNIEAQRDLTVDERIKLDSLENEKNHIMQMKQKELNSSGFFN